MVQLKSAYRLKVKDYHPDHGGDENQFVLIKKALDLLTDPRRRTEYDKQLGLRKFGDRTYRITRPFNIKTSVRDLYDDVKEVVFNKLGSGSGGKLFLFVKAEDVFMNSDGIIILAPELEITCPKCMGFGGFMGGCRKCGGSGRIKKEFLIPFESNGVLSTGDRLEFCYERFKIKLEID